MTSPEQFMHELHARSVAGWEQIARGHQQLVATHNAIMLSNEQRHQQELQSRHEAHQRLLSINAERNRIELESERQKLQDKYDARVRQQRQQWYALWKHAQTCPGCNEKPSDTERKRAAAIAKHGKSPK